MSNDDQKEIEKVLSEKYFLIPKGKVWHFLGGVVAVVLALGIFNWNIAKKAAGDVIEDTAGREATREILEYKTTALRGLQTISETLLDVEKTASTLKDPNHILGWTKVYQTDARGVGTYGKIESLTGAIKKGADVKISFTAKGKETDHRSYMECEWTFVSPHVVTPNEIDIVSCMNSSHISMKRKDGAFSFPEKAYRWIVLADTTSSFNMSRWFIEGGKKGKGNTEKREMEWFVKLM